MENHVANKPLRGRQCRGSCAARGAMDRLNHVFLAAFLFLCAAACFAQPPAPTDAQIAGIVLTANRIDIEAGMLAQNKGSSKDVKRFASKMVKDHSAVSRKAGALARRLGVTPQESHTSKSLRHSAAAARSKLAGLSGADFDRAYIDNEVAYLQGVVQVLDQMLVPSAQHWQVRAALTKVRPAFVAHLEQAKELQQRMQ